MSRLGDVRTMAGLVRKEWSENSRLRMTVLAAGVLGVIYLIIHLNSWRQVAESSAVSAVREYQDISLAAADNGWPDRARQIENDLAELQQWLWQASSEGDARAQLQNWLQTRARELDITVEPVQIDIGRSAQGITYRPVRAEIKGVYEPGKWQEFVSEISSARPVLIIESDSINRASENNQKFQMNVTAWFNLLP